MPGRLGVARAGGVSDCGSTPMVPLRSMQALQRAEGASPPAGAVDLKSGQDRPQPRETGRSFDPKAVRLHGEEPLFQTR
jgi:hypothetical protein